MSLLQGQMAAGHCHAPCSRLAWPAPSAPPAAPLLSRAMHGCMGRANAPAYWPPRRMAVPPLRSGPCGALVARSPPPPSAPAPPAPAPPPARRLRGCAARSASASPGCSPRARASRPSRAVAVLAWCLALARLRFARRACAVKVALHCAPVAAALALSAAAAREPIWYKS